MSIPGWKIEYCTPAESRAAFLRIGTGLGGGCGGGGRSSYARWLLTREWVVLLIGHPPMRPQAFVPSSFGADQASGGKQLESRFKSRRFPSIKSARAVSLCPWYRLTNSLRSPRSRFTGRSKHDIPCGTAWRQRSR